METTFEQHAEACRELLSKVKTLNVLADIKQEISKLKGKIDFLSSSEYAYCESVGANSAFDKTLEIIDLEIKKLKEN